jgi:hypothetical protein
MEPPRLDSNQPLLDIVPYVSIPQAAHSHSSLKSSAPYVVSSLPLQCRTDWLLVPLHAKPLNSLVHSPSHLTHATGNKKVRYSPAIGGNDWNRNYWGNPLLTLGSSMNNPKASSFMKSGGMLDGLRLPMDTLVFLDIVGQSSFGWGL